MTAVRVLYFAALRERLGRDSETLELAGEARQMREVLSILRRRGGEWAAALAEGQALGFAVNWEFAELSTAVEDGDEVAIFPPITGG